MPEEPVPVATVCSAPPSIWTVSSTAVAPGAPHRKVVEQVLAPAAMVQGLGSAVSVAAGGEEPTVRDRAFDGVPEGPFRTTTL